MLMPVYIEQSAPSTSDAIITCGMWTGSDWCLSTGLFGQAIAEAPVETGCCLNCTTSTWQVSPLQLLTLPRSAGTVLTGQALLLYSHFEM